MTVTSTVTISNLATTAHAAYEPNGNLDLGANWRNIDTSSLSSSLQAAMVSKGYYGVASVNLVTGEVVIGNRGTILITPNLSSDIQLGVGVIQNAQVVANRFAFEATQLAATQLNGGQITHLYLTGHSLGGAESEGQTAYLSTLISKGKLLNTDVQLTNVSFDAPGIGPLSLTGDSRLYTSYNISAQGDLIHYAGGADLAGTTVVAAPYGPSLASTAGLLGAGEALRLGPLGILGNYFVADGLYNTGEAHRIDLLRDGIAQSAIGETKVTDLAGSSGTQIANLLGVTKTEFDQMTQQQKAEVLARLPDPSAPPVYNLNGYDQYGFDNAGYNLEGHDKNGHLDPAISSIGGTTRTITSPDGSVTTVIIAGDGSYTETVRVPNESTIISHVGVDGTFDEITMQGVDGATSTATRAADGTTTIASQKSYADGSSIIVARTINPDGSTEKSTTIVKALDGSSTATSVGSDGVTVTAKQNIDGSSDSLVTYPDGHSVRTKDNGLGSMITYTTDVNGEVNVTVSEHPGNSTVDEITPQGEHIHVWTRWDGAHGQTIVDALGNLTESSSVNLTHRWFDGTELVIPDAVHPSGVPYQMELSYSHTLKTDGSETWTLAEKESSIFGVGTTTVHLAKANGVYVQAQFDYDGPPPLPPTTIFLRAGGTIDWPRMEQSAPVDRQYDPFNNFYQMVKYVSLYGAVGSEHQEQPDWTSDTSLVSAQSAVLSDAMLDVKLTGSDALSVMGNNHDNLIIANNGNDTIDGGGGNDTLIGGNGQDVFTALAIDGKNDKIIAGKGGSQFLVNTGKGVAHIEKSLATDKIVFGSGMTASDVTAHTFTNSAGATVVQLSTVSGGNIYVEANSATGLLQGVEFSDGSHTTLSSLLVRSDPGKSVAFSAVGGVMAPGVVELTLTGTASVQAQGNDLDNIIRANSGDDILIAGRGYTTLVSGIGTNTLIGGDNLSSHGKTTFHIDRGNGQTTISGSSFGDVLQFGVGIRPEDVHAGAPVTSWDGSSTTIQVWLLSGEQVVLNVGKQNHVLDKIQFSDGASISLLDAQHQTPHSIASTVNVGDGVLDYHVSGTGDIIVTANNNDLVVTGNAADDTFIGGTGNATFIGAGAAGTVTTFVAGRGTTVMVASDNEHAYNAVNINQNSGDVIIKNASRDSWINFGDNIRRADVAAHAFLANDGSNAIRLSLSNGHTVTIQDSNGASLLRDVSFNGDASTSSAISDLLAGTDGLATTATGSVDGVVPWGILRYTLTGNQDLTVTGNGLNEVIVGNAGNDTLISGSGKDVLVAGTGTSLLVHGKQSISTIFEIDANSGNTVIQSMQGDTLQLGEGLTIDDVTAQVRISNITGSAASALLFMKSGAVIQVYSVDPAISGPLDYLHFSDGTTTSIASLPGPSSGTDVFTSAESAILPDNYHTMVVTGTESVTATGNASHSVLIANNAGDTLIAGTGSATLVGGAGADHFIVNNSNVLVIDQYSASDDVTASVNFKLSAGIANLTGSGTEHLVLAGNDSIFSTVVANDAGDTLVAGAGGARLVGGHGLGADRFIGGLGDNDFVVSNKDSVVEANSDALSNTVHVSVDYSMPTNATAMFGIGDNTLTLRGNDQSNFIITNNAGATVYAGSGISVVESLSDGISTLIGGTGAAALLASFNDTVLTAGTAATLIAGGQGNDVITLGASASVLAYSLGGGHDTVIAGSASHNVLSLGGGLSIADINFSRTGADLKLSFGGEDSVLLQNWYAGSSNQAFDKLQLIEQASTDFAPDGNDPVTSSNVAVFDFASLVHTFDAFNAQNPNAGNWSAASALPALLIDHSADAAYGGDLAFYLGINQQLAGMDLQAAYAAVGDHDFAIHLQQIHDWDSISWHGSLQLI
ncbi:beta strand repeat-containing protein [Duganella violaceipulchra]|uniref:Ca2+-binding RTX toxin-like protein n=1 Tax=Duganella violaceipulchra TaxID=2849652 RepID=A0AA41HI04_9BURK|nr:hypothetical protein [Duganella violaceicalia]MBV6324889.1 hypothetical protein [Duganella violaceicalia]MCP2012364.1 Ca2+-binding RTX toxin-like protein [Duganella violaceicalia]